MACLGYNGDGSITRVNLFTQVSPLRIPMGRAQEVRSLRVRLIVQN